MAEPLSPVTLRICVLFGLVAIYMTWIRALNKEVPDAYLDEVFHVPQAQAYWEGRWSHWDDKITTPPGLYLWSYVFNLVRRVTAEDPGAMLSVEELRFSNVALAYIMIITLSLWPVVAGRSGTGEAILQREIVMMAFPLLTFFSGLYYTDLFSVWTVVATFVVWEQSRISSGIAKFGCQAGHVILGLLSLATRQTNIFWVAVFLGGLQLVETVMDNTTNIRDPEVGVARIEDTLQLALQISTATLTLLPKLLLSLWPHLTLLGAFTTFIIWNSGVVLGDKSNHIATIHVPQLLYIWPCIVFFSWPVLITQFTKTNLDRLRQQLPRPWLAMIIMLAMATAVHFNTIIHPFTLADNRHYVFYVFRLLTRHWWVKYAAVPIYFVCACLVIGALGAGKRQDFGADSTVSLSIVLVWLASTTLSLVTAPLVEPRYFIVPWLVWRLYVPQVEAEVAEDIMVPEQPDLTPVPAPTPKKKKKGQQKHVAVAIQAPPPPQPELPRQNVLQTLVNELAMYSLWYELIWYLIVNTVTCWVFLNMGFEWEQEPEKVQRFMW